MSGSGGDSSWGNTGNNTQSSGSGWSSGSGSNSEWGASNTANSNDSGWGASGVNPANANTADAWGASAAAPTANAFPSTTAPEQQQQQLAPFSQGGESQGQAFVNAENSNTTTTSGEVAPAPAQQATTESGWGWGAETNPANTLTSSAPSSDWGASSSSSQSGWPTDTNTNANTNSASSSEWGTSASASSSSSSSLPAPSEKADAASSLVPPPLTWAAPTSNWPGMDLDQLKFAAAPASQMPPPSQPDVSVDASHTQDSVDFPQPTSSSSAAIEQAKDLNQSASEQQAASEWGASTAFSFPQEQQQENTSTQREESNQQQQIQEAHGDNGSWGADTTTTTTDSNTNINTSSSHPSPITSDSALPTTPSQPDTGFGNAWGSQSSHPLGTPKAESGARTPSHHTFTNSPPPSFNPVVGSPKAMPSPRKTPSHAFAFPSPRAGGAVGSPAKRIQREEQSQSVSSPRTTKGVASPMKQSVLGSPSLRQGVQTPTHSHTQPPLQEVRDQFQEMSVSHTEAGGWNQEPVSDPNARYLGV